MTEELLEERDDEPTEAELAEPRLKDSRDLPARFHHLRAAGVAGAHAKHAFTRGDKENLATRLGAGTHADLLGKPWVLFDEPSKASVDRRKKATKLAETARVLGQPIPGIPKLTRSPRSGDVWNDFQSRHKGALILTPPERDKARRLADAIRNHPRASRLLFSPDRPMIFEQPIIWSQNGRARQSTPDARSRDGEINVEIKTTRSADPFWFRRDAERMAYHAQVADQGWAIAHAHGRDRLPRESYIIAVEKSLPHIVTVFELEPSDLELGTALCSRWLEKLVMCETTQIWGGYSDQPVPLGIPRPFEEAEVIADPDWVSPDEENRA